MAKNSVKQSQWALILGGSSGLGWASAKKLAIHGYNICIVHRNSRSEMHQINESFEEIKKLGGEFLSFNADAIIPDNIEMILSALKEKIGDGKVGCLLHSIAKGNLKPMVDDNLPVLRNEDFIHTVNYMAVSLYDWTRALHEKKLFAEDTRILSFTSEGNRKAYIGYGAVSVAKAAIEAITRNIAVEFAQYGIRANCIQAGVVETSSQKLIPGSEKMIQYAESKNPFGRITTAEDVANVVYLMCKKEAGWINGTVIIVDGGESIS